MKAFRRRAKAVSLHGSLTPQVYVAAGEAIAFWEADIDGEFELADSLTSEVELMIKALNAKRSLSKRIVEEEHAQRQTNAGAIASSQTRRKPNRVVGSASVTQHHGDHADAVAVWVGKSLKLHVRRHLPKRKLWTLLAKACTTLKTTSGRMTISVWI